MGHRARRPIPSNGSLSKTELRRVVVTGVSRFSSFIGISKSDSQLSGEL